MKNPVDALIECYEEAGWADGLDRDALAELREYAEEEVVHIECTYMTDSQPIPTFPNSPKMPILTAKTAPNRYNHPYEKDS